MFKFLKSCFPLILLAPFFNIFTQLCRRKINFLNQIQFKKSIYLIECFLLQVHEDPFHIVRFQRYFMHIRINVIDSNFDRLFPYSLELQSLCNKSLEKIVSNRLTNFQDTVVFLDKFIPKLSILIITCQFLGVTTFVLLSCHFLITLSVQHSHMERKVS